MSLRDTHEQSAFEHYCDDIARACAAAGIPEPDDYGQRWYRGETLAEVLGDMRLRSMMERVA